MAGKYYLGLDNGTTGTTALILNEKWECVGRGYKELTQHYPKPGWVEHDAI
ncbi:MAG: glycerol kinase, partial [Firmicutes bacterium]|nr:glycerol kinase [Bacillota bacterium]